MESSGEFKSSEDEKEEESPIGFLLLISVPASVILCTALCDSSPKTTVLILLQWNSTLRK